MTDYTPTLEARVRALETSLHHIRRLAMLLGLALVLVAGVAMVPQATDPATPPLLSQSADVTTGRLILTNPASPGVVLLPGPESSLIIQTSSGEEILRIGGPAGRHVIVR